MLTYYFNRIFPIMLYKRQCLLTMFTNCQSVVFFIFTKYRAQTFRKMWTVFL